MDIEAEDYKELPSSAIIQYPVLTFANDALTTEQIYEGTANLDPIAVGAEYFVKIPTFRALARAFFIKWNMTQYASINSSGAVPLGVFALRTILFQAFVPSNVMFNNVPYRGLIYPDLRISGMTEALQSITLKKLTVQFTVRGSDLAPNANFIPTLGVPDQSVVLKAKPVITAIF